MVRVTARARADSLRSRGGRLGSGPDEAAHHCCAEVGREKILGPSLTGSRKLIYKLFGGGIRGFLRGDSGGCQAASLEGRIF